MKAIMEHIAPMNTGKDRKPTFVVAGHNGARIPLSELQQMVEKLATVVSPLVLMAKDEGHGFSKNKSQDFQFYATTMSVKRFAKAAGWEEPRHSSVVCAARCQVRQREPGMAILKADFPVKKTSSSSQFFLTVPFFLL